MIKTNTFLTKFQSLNNNRLFIKTIQYALTLPTVYHNLELDV